MRALLLTLLLSLAAAPAYAADYTLPETCVVDLVDDHEVHATVAGILDHVGVKEGDRVRTEDVLVKIDTDEPEIQKKIAQADLLAARKRASDTIDIEYSMASEEVAAANLESLLQSNRAVPKSVPETDIMTARLEKKRAFLGIKKAKNDRGLAGLDARVKEAELEAAEVGIERRTLRAPFTGMVAEQFRREKEWVQPGEKILRLIRLDELKVEGFVPIAKHRPSELAGCEVTVKVNVGGGRRFQATGRIVYVNPIVQRGRDSQIAPVRAEITNRQENGYWVISPGMTAEMTIHLGTGGVSAAQSQGPGARGRGPGASDGQRQ